MCQSINKCLLLFYKKLKGCQRSWPKPNGKQNNNVQTTKQQQQQKKQIKTTKKKKNQKHTKKM